MLLALLAAAPQAGASSLAARPRADGPPGQCEDVLRCRLPRELALTDEFLRRRKHGLPITLDPRPLPHTLEVLRLNVMSQAMGYLNLYRSTRVPRLRDEALGRIEYLLGLGDDALGNGPRDGMYGYLMLDAYELLGDARFLRAGLRAAERCRSNATDADLSMNAGLMCALNHAYASRLTGQPAGAAFADEVVDRTAPKQFEDGAFPHLPTLLAGKNLGYSAWMATELMLLREARPENELTEILLVRSVRFLRNRVTADGSISYREGDESFASDPGNADPRFWTNELASVALDLAVAGHRDEASRALAFLFEWRMDGPDRGGYPDKYAQVDTTNIWETGRPSVLRTSLIFWYLTLLQRYDQDCAGPVGPCVAAGDNCTQLYRELGLCDRGQGGTITCIGGRATRCFDQEHTAMRAGRLCDWSHVCVDEPEGGCWYTCPVLGSRLCVGDTCVTRCQDLEVAHDQCDRQCAPGTACSEPSRLARGAAAARQDSLAEAGSRPGRAPLMTTRGSGRIVVTLESAASVELGLYDVAGRLVRRLWSGPLPAGVSMLDWDRRGDDGVRAMSGVYFARLRTGPTFVTSRIVLVR